MWRTPSVEEAVPRINRKSVGLCEFVSQVVAPHDVVAVPMHGVVGVARGRSLARGAAKGQAPARRLPYCSVMAAVKSTRMSSTGTKSLRQPEQYLNGRPRPWPLSFADGGRGPFFFRIGMLGAVARGLTDVAS